MSALLPRLAPAAAVSAPHMPLASTYLRNRLLEMHGWQVVSIPFNIWAELGDRKEKEVGGWVGAGGGGGGGWRRAGGGGWLMGGSARRFHPQSWLQVMCSGDASSFVYFATLLPRWKPPRCRNT
jgi:hypothetical protein